MMNPLHGKRIGAIAAAVVLAISLVPMPASAAEVITLDVPRLRAGALPALPYVDWNARRIVDGSRRVSISGIQNRVIELHKVDGGYLLRRTLANGWQDLVFASSGGARKVLVKLVTSRAIRVSKDGSKVLVNRFRMEADQPVYTDTAVLGLPSGRLLYSRDFGSQPPVLHLYGTDRAMLNVNDDADDLRPDVIWWTPATGGTEVIDDNAAVESADLSAWRWALRPQDDTASYGVRPIPPKTGSGWLLPEEDWNIGTWSPDNSLVWGNNEITDDHGSSSYVVFRASDGARLLTVQNEVVPVATWESDEALLLRTGYGSGDDRRYQLVRCRLSGACSRVGPATAELAGAIIPATRRG